MGKDIKNKVIEKLFEYDDFRYFLKDYFTEQKSLKSFFSHRYFAQKAGFNSSSFLHHVIHGKRGLSEESLKKLIKGLSIKGRKAHFFKKLVYYNLAQSEDEREKLFKDLNQIRKSEGFKPLSKKQYTYLDEWYFPAIRELVVYSNWQDDFFKLGQMVYPPISADKARNAVETLVAIGAIKKDKNGRYKQEHLAITAQNVPAEITKKIRHKYLDLAGRAMESLPVEERFISSATVVISEEKYKELTERLDEIRKYIVTEAVDDLNTERVYQFNFQAFPLSLKFEGDQGELGK